MPRLKRLLRFALPAALAGAIAVAVYFASQTLPAARINAPPRR